MQAILDPLSIVRPVVASASSEVELLRFFTAGSVDDGKSTLIGRLLHDSNNLYDDHFESIRQRSKTRGQDEEIDWALLTDGLKAEREQGITIDVAYRYFSTKRRKFIIADTPGHRQYTRNMATGASTADLGLVLVDARHGLRAQSMRHTLIAHLLRVPKLLVVINKMDLVEYSQAVYERILDDFRRFWRELGHDSEIEAVPVSALRGDNVVDRSSNMPWYDGPSVLDRLESIPVPRHSVTSELRFPVQYVARPNLDFRGYCGVVTSGVVRVGDEIAVLPSGETSRVKDIVTYDGMLSEATAPLSVTLVLEDEIDISRGDMLVHPRGTAKAGRDFAATIVWMDEESLDLNKEYFLKQTTRTTRTTSVVLEHGVDVETLQTYDAETLATNDIGRVRLSTYDEVVYDGYDVNRGTGSFILIDPHTNRTVAAGMLDGGELTPVSGTPEPVRVQPGGQRFAVVSPDRELGHKLALGIARRMLAQGTNLALVANPSAARLQHRADDEALIVLVDPRRELTLPAEFVRVHVSEAKNTELERFHAGWRAAVRIDEIDVVAERVLASTGDRDSDDGAPRS